LWSKSDVDGRCLEVESLHPPIRKSLIPHPRSHHLPFPSPNLHVSISIRFRVLAYLQLVLASLSLRRGVEEVDRENLSTTVTLAR
jgi:hypothetical protein